MCGVAGILRVSPVAQAPTREELVRMASALSHRGPDELGLYRDGELGFGHARLSIVDLATGQQPLANEDDSLWICFNGEIFNYVELRAQLLALGHRFRTHSDTEVIVHAYEAWGADAFARMNGQWAVALWDKHKHELVLCRDRTGIAPLHLCEHAGRLYFGSEIKAIFAADASIPRELDPASLAELFTFWTPVAPRTAFRGVEELRPGYVRSYGPDGMREHAYASADVGRDERISPSALSLADAVEQVRAALHEATRLRMVRADVPVGSYLSGGLDSSLIAALGNEHSGGRLQTFSLRFADAEYDETPFQQLMAAHLGSEHHEVRVSRGDIARVFPSVVAHAERPILRTAPAPMFLLSELVRKSGIKVVLTGEGADEMFAGYDLFREAKVRRFWAKHPESVLRPRLLHRLYPYLSRSPVAQQAVARQFFGRDLGACTEPGFGHGPRWQGTSALLRLLSPATRAAATRTDVTRELLDSLPRAFRSWTPLAQDQCLEIRTLLSGYLLSAQGDRMLLGHSIEGRFPFLDDHVIALANRLPDSYKLHVLDEKHVLKRLARGLVPDAILARSKQPYRAPDALSFLDAKASDYVEPLLSEASVAKAGVFDPKLITQLWNKCKTRGSRGQLSNTDNMALVGALSVQLLQESMVCARAPTRLDTPIRLIERSSP